MPSLNKLLYHISLIATSLLVSSCQSNTGNQQKIDLLEAYSFDFSAHKAPLAYRTYDAAVELFTRTKLIPPVKSKYGAVFLKKVRLSLVLMMNYSNYNHKCLLWMSNSLFRVNFRTQ